MNRFTHFELVTDDFEKTAAFYDAVFGWNVHKWEGPVAYWLVESGDASPPGINGGEIIMPKGPIPGVGFLAYFKDNTGIIVGLHQPDPNAGM